MTKQHLGALASPDDSKSTPAVTGASTIHSIAGIRQYVVDHIRHRARKHHVVIGAGSLVATLCVGLVLLVPGKSRKARADVAEVVTITAPTALANSTAETASLPALPQMGAFVTRDIPHAETLMRPLVSITNHDGIPLYGSTGLYKRPNVMLTKDLAAFAQGLSKYFASNRMQAMITSGVRTGDRQLDIIKERIAEYGMSRQFPGLEDATVSDKEIWEPAWEWLKARHVPVNPPADYVNDEGTKVGGSLHLKGLAMDVVSDDLDALRDALSSFAASSQRGGILRITGLTRERDCVHISLGK